MPAEPRAEPARGTRRDKRPSLTPFVLAAIVGFLVGDAFRPPDRQAIARAAVGAIDLYRATVSPALAKSGVVRCRFTPTCSAYGREAIARYGNPKGFVLTAGRILRCNPWAEGGEDPVR